MTAEFTEASYSVSAIAVVKFLQLDDLFTPQLTFLQSCYPTCISSSHLKDLNVKLTYPVILLYLNRFSLLM